MQSNNPQNHDLHILVARLYSCKSCHHCTNARACSRPALSSTIQLHESGWTYTCQDNLRYDFAQYIIGTFVIKNDRGASRSMQQVAQNSLRWHDPPQHTGQVLGEPTQPVLHSPTIIASTYAARAHVVTHMRSGQAWRQASSFSSA